MKRIMIACAFLVFLSSFGMFKKPITHVLKPAIQPEITRMLIEHSCAYLKNNRSKLVCQHNESGFVRFNISKPLGLSDDIEKMRINFWPSKTDTHVDPETIHTHPRYFESFLVHGGYTHSLYEQDNDHDDYYDHYRIYKPSVSEKKFLYVGNVGLRYTHDQDVEKGMYVGIPTGVIHRVVKTNPQTLSLNVVYRAKKMQEYDLFLSPNTSLSNVKTERQFLSDDETQSIASQAMELMDKFLADN